jgi:hypothetical protein
MVLAKLRIGYDWEQLVDEIIADMDAAKRVVGVPSDYIGERIT